MKRKIVYVGFKFSHMGAHAGYDQIRNYTGYDIFVDCQDDYNRHERFYKKKSLLSKITGRLFAGYIFRSELRCLLLAIKQRNLTFHFVYAENTYRLIWLFKWLGLKFVCTYHQPESFYRENPQFLIGLRHIDHIIVLSSEAKGYFDNLVGKDKVSYIPHGVDIEFFTPPTKGIKQHQVLMVGNWLRDFGFADSVFQELLKIDSEVKIVVVSSKSNHDLFTKNERLILRSGITDDELLDYCRTSKLLFLPLKGFVANNAVMEMSAIGSRVLIASDQRPSGELEELAEHVSLNKALAIDAIIRALRDQRDLSKEKRGIVSSKYSWTAVGQKVDPVLRHFS